MLSKIRMLYALVALSALLTSESGYASAFRGEGHYRRIVQEDSGTQALATLVEGILALQQASPPLTPPTPTPEGAPLPLSPFPSPSPPLPSPPPECPPLPSLEVVPPGLGQAWEGSLESGLAGLSPALGGNITDLQDRLAVIVDRDPTAPADVAKNVMMVTYQPGMAGPQGGASFFIYPFGRDSTLGNSVRLQFKVMFEVGFDWSRGGTLPGLFQGPVSDDVDQQPCFRAWQAGAQGVDCFAIRPQWKAGGNIELSMHVPLGSQTCQFEEEAKGWQNPNSGVLLSQKGTPRLQRLKWHEFDIFVQLNDVGQANGQVLLTVDGAPLLSFPQVVIRTSQEQTVDAISFASFYIGTANTAPSKEQHVLFKDLRIETGPQEQLPPPFAPPPFSAPAPAPASFPPSPPPSPPPFPPPPPPPSPPPPTPPSPPPPSPPPCRPLRSTAVVAPDLVLKWMGDLDQGLAGMAMGFGGNITDQLDRQAVVVDRDPTLPDSASSNVIMVTYQPGMAGPQGGASFFIYPFGRDSTLGNSVRLQYKVMFEDGFDWNRGGTLPGLFQGPLSDDVDQQPCFGGWQAGQRGVDCFAFRPQWRAGGKIEFSMHIPQIRQICQLREESKGWGNPNRGILLSNPKGPAMEVLRWYLFDIFVQLNDVGRANGRVLLSVNGIPQFSFPRLVIRTSEEQTVDAISFASHYIGTANTAPTKEQHVLFKDFRILAGYMESPEQAASSPPPFPPLEPSTQLPTPAPAEATPQEGAVPLPEEIPPQ